MSKSPKKAKLISAIPKDRYFLKQGSAEKPSIGDIVALDQGTASPTGKPMVLVYYSGDNQSTRYEALVYETELGPDLEE